MHRGDIVVFDGTRRRSPVTAAPPDRAHRRTLAGAAVGARRHRRRRAATTSSGSSACRATTCVCCDADGAAHRQRRRVTEPYLYAGRRAERPDLRRHRPGRPALGDGRPPQRLGRLPGAPRRSRRRHGAARGRDRQGRGAITGRSTGSGAGCAERRGCLAAVGPVRAGRGGDPRRPETRPATRRRDLTARPRRRGHGDDGRRSGGHGARAAPAPSAARPARRRCCARSSSSSAWRWLLSFVVKTWLSRPSTSRPARWRTPSSRDDRVIVSKLTPGPFDLKRGDIVVFEDPGDWLDADARRLSASRLGGGRPRRADLRRPAARRLREPPHQAGHRPARRPRRLLRRRAASSPSTASRSTSPTSSRATRRASRTSTSPCRAGKVWVMGDHRSDSADSRFHDPTATAATGSVPIDTIVGRAVVVVWPLDHADLARRARARPSPTVPAPRRAGRRRARRPTRVGTTAATGATVRRRPSRKPSLRVERALQREGHRVLAGMDEVGRGALAGPVSGRRRRHRRDLPLGARRASRTPSCSPPRARERLVPRIQRWAVGLRRRARQRRRDRRDRHHGRAARWPGMPRPRRGCDVVPDLVILDGNHDWLTAPTEVGLFAFADDAGAGRPRRSRR